VFEEPIRHDARPRIAELVKRSPCANCAGESFHTLGEFAELGAPAGRPTGSQKCSSRWVVPLKEAAVIAEATTGFGPHQAGGPIATMCV